VLEDEEQEGSWPEESKQSWPTGSKYSSSIVMLYNTKPSFSPTVFCIGYKGGKLVCCHTEQNEKTSFLGKYLPAVNST